MIRLIALILWLLPLPAAAEEVVAALSQDRVSISTSFDGSEILVFGAVKRSSPPPDAAPLNVVITVAGPEERVVVRKKERRFGIWVNTEAVEVDAAPSFYAVASSAPLSQAISAVEDQRWRITTPRALRAVGVSEATDDVPAFLDALIRVRRAEDLYVSAPDTVALEQETLFSTTIALPSDLTEGDYVTRIFLTRDREVIDRYETTIYVQKVGLERFIYNLAHEQPLIYGILSLVIAIAAGWLASAVFRYIRT